MGLFDRFKKQESYADVVKKIIRSAESNASSDPVTNLCIAIYKASLDSTDAIRKRMQEIKVTENLPVGKESSLFLPILEEFLFFYFSVTDRIAFGQLGEEGIKKFRDESLPLIFHTHVETIFVNQSSQYKDAYSSTFPEMYNVAAERYSQATTMLDKEDPFMGMASLSILGRKIAEIHFSRMNPEIIMSVIELAARMIDKLNIQKYVMEYKAKANE